MSFLRIVSTLRAGRTSVRPVFSQSSLGSVRRMGGQSGGKAWAGFHPPYVAPVHKRLGTTMMTVMWLWLFYRAKEDGKAVLGLEHPWDHGHGGHGHKHLGDIQFGQSEIGGTPAAEEH